MFSFRRWLFCVALAMGSRMAAQPALTTIQDILYTADGNRFNGLITITWQTFDAGDSSVIAAQVARITISNGNLYVQLVPTTTATTPATYSVQYNSSGHTQYNEVWVVFPSATPLRIRDVRLSPGAVSTVGSTTQTTTVQISNVQGLQAALNLRPTQGIGFAVSRSAVINVSGGLDGAVGNLGDCMHVDGTSGACGTGGGGNTVFVDAETPAGTLDGINTIFTLASPPNPSTSLALYRNGLRQSMVVDYTLASNIITFQAAAVPRPADILLADYRLSVLPGVGFIDAETPSGTINGVNGSFTLVQAPSPASSLDLYRNGIRLESGVDYALSGNAITFGSVVPQIGDVLLCSYRIAQ
ncbi:MAG TPA: hypothetical protein VGP62_23540 [Bryobacteraceae bacterium]|jgi:hypothetical protein|nr:hypothetical protein [Bryobacteraceae bacterium]